MKLFIQRIQSQLNQGQTVDPNDIKLMIREVQQLEMQVMKLKQQSRRGY